MAGVVAVAIFLLMFFFIILDRIPREYITVICGAGTLILVFGLCMHSMSAVVETVNIHSIFTSSFWYSAGETTGESSGINWATIIFIAGMMIMVEGMARVGFFRWLCMRIARMVDYRPMRLLLAFMVMSFALSMFIDSITVILFLAAVTVELSQLLRFNPISMILAEIFCANLGGSATMCGDPPNIIIGTSLGYSFGDFVANTGIIAFMSLAVMLVYFYLVNRKEYGNISVDASILPDPASMITDRRGFAIHTAIFLLAVVLLITHAMTGLTVAFIGAFIAALTLMVSGKESIGIMKRVDYRTLIFFVGLFIVVGGLEQTGVLNVIATFIKSASDGKYTLMVAIIIWVSALASAFVDNIPFAATMIPVIKALSLATGMPLETLAWALSIGTDIGGSATPIGASANVVGISVCNRSGHFINWGKYCKTSVPATLIVLTIATAVIILRYL